MSVFLYAYLLSCFKNHIQSLLIYFMPVACIFYLWLWLGPSDDIAIHDVLLVF